MLPSRGRGSGPGGQRVVGMDWACRALIPAKFDCLCWARPSELQSHDWGADGRELSRGVSPTPEKHPLCPPHPGPWDFAPRVAVWPLPLLLLEPVGIDLPNHHLY